MATNSEITHFLSSTTSNATFLQKLKILYRPIVCPFNELLAYSDSAKSVFDIGCGSGQFCALIANFTNVGTIEGIEIDKSLVNNARRINQRFSKKKKLTFTHFNGTIIPDTIKKYDLVYMIDVYHHIPKKIRNDFMKQVYAKMKPGAKLMFKDIDDSSPFVVCNIAHDLIFAQELSHAVGFKSAVALLEALGFKIREARTKQVLVYPHYFILAEK